jgi:predicted nucleic acid-binding protein
MINEGKNMSTWLLDTPLFNMLATPKAKPLLEWCEANDASLFISAVSLTHIAQAISKLPGSQSQRAHAQRNWFDEIITGFADRIHPVDAKIATQAGALLPSFTTGYLQHRFHDALLVATARVHGNGLVTRREGIFGPWTQTPIAIV